MTDWLTHLLLRVWQGLQDVAVALASVPPLPAAIYLLGAYVAAAGALRINKLSPARHKRAWSLMYLVYAGFGVHCIWLQATQLPALETQLILLAGLTALAMNTALTHAQWQANQAPKIVDKGVTP